VYVNLACSETSAFYCYLIGDELNARNSRAKLSPVIGLQTLDGQRVDVGPRSVQQSPRERIEDGSLIFPRDLH